MRIISNTLDVEIQKWSDPGDYPNSAAGEPLPSYDYVSDVNGEVRVELSTEEVLEFQEAREAGEVQDWVSNLDIPLPDGTLSVDWNVQLIDQTAVLTVAEFEPDPALNSHDDYGDE